MSDELDHLTDEDYEAIGRIVDGGIRRAQGEDLLAAMEGADERQAEANRALLDLIARARQAQEGEQE